MAEPSVVGICLVDSIKAGFLQQENQSLESLELLYVPQLARFGLQSAGGAGRRGGIQPAVENLGHVRKVDPSVVVTGDFCLRPPLVL